MQETKRRSAQAWREMVGRFGQSGLSEEVFCEGEGISRKLFHRWRCKRGMAPPRISAVKATTIPKATAGFMDLGALAGGGSRLEVRLDLGGGVLLHLARG
jgi:putative transposase